MAMVAEGLGCKQEGQLWVGEIGRVRTIYLPASFESNRSCICTQQCLISLELGERQTERDREAER